MKKYLGDDIYVEVTYFGVRLTYINQSIFINPRVWKNLKEFMERSKETDKSGV